jgi:hypothetical protein
MALEVLDEVALLALAQREPEAGVEVIHDGCPNRCSSGC